MASFNRIRQRYMVFYKYWQHWTHPDVGTESHGTCIISSALEVCF